MIPGKRIRLRCIDRDDLPVFVRWFNDPEVRQFLSILLPLSQTQEERWFENMLQQPPETHPLMIEVNIAESWQAIGNTGFVQINWYNRDTEIGIVIGEKSFWNRGYGSEAMRLMLKHAFNTLNLNRVYLRVYETNLRGIRAYEKAGFIQEGRMRQALYREGKYFDILLMSILRSEWQESEEL